MWNRVAILAFHLAIFSNPQHPVVVLTIASLLCNKTLEESINFARQNGPVATVYIPEIISVLDNLSDGEIIERVTQFVGQVRKSVDGLINKNSLFELMSRFPEFPCSGLVSTFWYFNLITYHEWMFLLSWDDIYSNLILFCLIRLCFCESVPFLLIYALYKKIGG